MSTITQNLTRIQQAKADIKTAIEAKGVTVPSSATIDTYDDYVSQISGGSCDDSVLINLIERDIESIDIPSGTTTIGAYAFYYCSSLTNITIPSGVTSIGNYAFYRCGSLTSIDIPSGVTSIGSQAFQYCSSLSSCTIGSGVISIGGNAFTYCSNLTSIDIPDSVTSIGNGVFGYCYSLTSCTIGSGVTSIGSNAFNSCTSLISITVEATTPPTLSNVNAFNNTNNCPIYVPSASVTTYQTTDNWTSLSSRIQAMPNS